MKKPAAGAQGLTVVSERPADPVAGDGESFHVVHAPRIGRDLRLRITRPLATPFLPGQSFPVIVAPDDGNHVAGPLARHMGIGMAMAQAVVVSVGYPPGSPPVRNTDLTHAVTQGLDGVTTFGGGGAAFAAMLAQDLPAFVTARAPADFSRAVLVGHSLGGLFAANVLAGAPDAYAGYVIASPSVWADATVLERVEKAAARARGVRVFLCVGSHEDGFALPEGRTPMLTGFAGLELALRRAPRLALKAQVYQGEGHNSVYSRMLLDAYPFVLPPGRPLSAAAPRIDDKALARLAGDYVLADRRRINVFRQGKGPLMARVDGGPPAFLIYEGGRRFYSPFGDLHVQFDGAGFTLTALGANPVHAERAP